MTGGTRNGRFRDRVIDSRRPKSGRWTETEDGKSRLDMDAEGRTRQDNPEEPKNGQNRLDRVRKP